jgi:hypothetical protein
MFLRRMVYEHRRGHVTRNEIAPDSTLDNLSGVEREELTRPGVSPTDLVHLLDALICVYVSWREECAAVTRAYQDWTAAQAGDGKLAHAAYVAALDREEKAATMYGGLVAQIADAHRALGASAPRPGGAQRAGVVGVVPWNPGSIAARLWRP